MGMRGKRVCLLLACVTVDLLLPHTATTQQAAADAVLERQLDSVAAVLLESGAVGITVAVQRHDEVVLAKGYGYADVENAVSATDQTVYRIGSLTKQFTAAAIMQLVDAGQVELTAPLSRYLPEYKGPGAAVTIRQLLTHTSGIPNYGAGGDRDRLDPADGEILAIFEAEPLEFPPGSQYSYSNSGYYVLGEVIEAVSGLAYSDYVEQRIFEPLGLAGSSYCTNEVIVPLRAEGYQLLDGELANAQYLSMDRAGAAGALCSNARDLLAWTTDLRSGVAVTRDSYQSMITPPVLADGTPSRSGFGLNIDDVQGHQRVWHAGQIHGFTSLLASFPDAGVDFVLLANLQGAPVGRLAPIIRRWALGF